MGPIPLQRDTVHRPGTTGTGRAAGPPLVSRTSLPGSALAPSAGGGFVRAVLSEWSGLGMPAVVGFAACLADEAVAVTETLLGHAVAHASRTGPAAAIDLSLRLEDPVEDRPPVLVVEVTDRPAEGPGEDDEGQGPPAASYGTGFRRVAAHADSWGVTHRAGSRTLWARLPVDDWTTPVADPPAAPAHAGAGRPRDTAPGTALPGQGSGPGTGTAALATAPGEPVPEPAAPHLPEPARPEGAAYPEHPAYPAHPAHAGAESGWDRQGALAFLAEAADLLTGRLDEDLVASIAARLLVPRLADWCAIWLEGGEGGGTAVPRLARVRHRDERGAGPVRALLEKAPLRLPASTGAGPVTLPWPPDGRAAEGRTGLPGDHAGNSTALACRITAGGRALGTVLVGRDGGAPLPEAVVSLVEDFVRRLGLAVGAARSYGRQATISRVLQRGLLPSRVADIPGVTSALVYEPADESVAGGDFYDIFACPGGRWAFVLGDVQGSGPEAAVVTGLVRPWLRLLSREGFGVGEVLDRLNRLLLDDAVEAAEAAALMVAAAGGQQLHDAAHPRFLSLLHGEAVPLPGGGARITVASAGHPLPLLLGRDGSVRAVAEPQVLLGVVDEVAYQSQTFDLEPGQTLLCVTDGVTERRSGAVLFDDGDGLARTLAGCAGLSAGEIADRINRAVHAFDERPPDDDLALMVLRAE
ncbi:SpoIIE family protein phosphatase [uncultured Streptomyces sp.]|uniref:ATP-binding SpoIIE family protein phosphatase n=1 Tax=uncultured Streptomyces sp. TaxID=174707 RepID=UPI002607268A|nr:SpoIIE family protein phosphatase [uncultured Streptomyces sp.]